MQIPLLYHPLLADASDIARTVLRIKWKLMFMTQKFFFGKKQNIFLFIYTVEIIPLNKRKKLRL